jgi:hypothetical protein
MCVYVVHVCVQMCVHICLQVLVVSYMHACFYASIVHIHVSICMHEPSVRVRVWVRVSFWVRIRGWG